MAQVEELPGVVDLATGKNPFWPNLFEGMKQYLLAGYVWACLAADGL